MLQLALQLGDARRRLLVLFLKHLRMEALWRCVEGREGGDQDMSEEGD